MEVDNGFSAGILIWIIVSTMLVQISHHLFVLCRNGTEISIMRDLKVIKPRAECAELLGDLHRRADGLTYSLCWGLMKDSKHTP